MPVKDFTKWIEGGIISVWRFTRGGKTTRFRVALLVEVANEQRCITRYDTAHGYAHRDVLAFDGSVIRKEPMEETDFDLAFQAAFDELSSNHERYLADFLATRTR